MVKEFGKHAKRNLQFPPFSRLINYLYTFLLAYLAKSISHRWRDKHRCKNLRRVQTENVSFAFPEKVNS